MKTTILLLLLTQISLSQNISVSKIDEFTKKEVLQINASKGKNWKTADNISKGFFNNVFLSLHKQDSLKILMLDMTFGTNICVNNYEGKSIILLEDDNTVELLQVSKIDCSVRVAVQYYLKEEDILKLSNNLIKKIRIYTSDGYLDFDIKPDKKEIIKNTFLLFKNKI